MPGFSLGQLFNVVSARMVALGAIYPVRAALRTARSQNPSQRGPRFWRTALKELRTMGHPNRRPLEAFTAPGQVIDARVDEQARVLVHCQNGTLRVSAFDGDLIELRYRTDGDFQPPFSYSVVRSEASWEGMPIDVTEGDDQITLATGALTLVIKRADGHLTLLDADGQTLFAQGRGMQHAESGHVAWGAHFSEATPFYGLGEKASQLNHAGQHFELWNSDPSGYGRGKDPIYMSIPFMMALTEGQAVGVYVDNTYRAWVDFGSETPGDMTYQAAGGEMRLYLMAGTPARVLEQYTALTGRMSLPPLWAFGLHQSRWSYYPQGRVLELAKEFRRRKLPCDVIHLDIHYMDGYRSFMWDRERFPSLDKMVETIGEAGFKTLTMIDPGIKVDPGYRVYDEGVANGYFVEYPDGTRFTGPVWPGDCHFPDFTDPAVREWWGEQYRDLLDSGVAAFWNDMNEPAIITAGVGPGAVPGVLQHDKEGLGASHEEMHNVYGMQMVRASVEGLKRLRPDRRALILSRSGWAGLQRYGILWTGDNQSTWDHLALTIPMVANLGMSGIAVTGPDTGGFSGGPSAELFARWIELGAFTPFLRIHSMVGSADQEPWAFGEDVEAISRKYLELRYRLLPTIYTAAWQAAQTGRPIARALAFDYPADEQTHNLDSEYLFGDAFLVAPVLSEGGTGREVYLPEGVWYDFWRETQHAGGQTLSVDAPLDTLPLLVRGGAVVALWPVQQYVGERAINELTLRVYIAPGEHISQLYEDNGLRPDYESDDAHRISRFVLTGGADSCSLSREIVARSYTPEYSTLRLEIVGLDREPRDVTLQGGEVLDKTWNAEVHRLYATIEAEGNFQLHFV